MIYGCRINLVYKKAIEEMDLEVKKESGLGEMRGLGNLRLGNSRKKL